MLSKSRDIQLATNWRVSRVRRSLRRKNIAELVMFLRARHNERFFEPIRVLKGAHGNYQGYGFAMMTLCSLLIETIQSFRDGLPTTYGAELARCRRLSRVPAPFQIPSGLRVNGKQAFQRFFRTYRGHFPGVNAIRFYKNVRNGLLHQGQTKAGWTISQSGPHAFDAASKIIYRNNFTVALEECFEDYLRELGNATWTDSVWVHASRKIWWLIRLS
jgi:hypothetical protein